MNSIIEGIKAILKEFFKQCSTPEPIETVADYRRVKKWVKKAIKLYSVFTVIGFIVIFVAFLIIISNDISIINAFLMCLFLLTCWGYATLILYFRPIIKSVAKWGVGGYRVGEKIETTHVNVTHEYGNTYRVSSYTENKGCLFAIFAAGARFFVWAFFCVYIGPFLTVKKIKRSIVNLKKYEISAKY